MAESITHLGIQISDAIQSGQPLADCSDMLLNYVAADWKEHISFSTRGYNRLLLYRSEYIDIYLICWDTGQNSPIHDHPDNGCLLLVLQGALQEDNYLPTTDGVSVVTKMIHAGDISFRQRDSLHRIINSATQTVSMHVYSPPGYIPKHYRFDDTV